MGLKEVILNFMKEEAYKPMEIPEIAKIFNINKNEYKSFKKAIKTMEKEGLLARDESDKLGLAQRMGVITGKIEIHDRGFGFLIPDIEGIKDLFIAKTNLMGAMNGDRVVAKIIKEGRNGKRTEGIIINIVERVNKNIVGIYEDNKSFGFVLPEDKRIQNDIFISKKDRNGAKKGQIVMVEITRWPDGKRKNPEGKVVEILGRPGDKGIDIDIIIRKYNLPEDFPPSVLNSALDIEDFITEDEIKGRLDLRNIKMVTIDGEDAKDLDDAVSIERLENGNFKLGVHIADVTHYVKERSVIDKEAFKRATSVYLIDRVIPMLPKKLSNGICSLNPKVDRLTLSCIMEVNRQGKVVNHTIAQSVIKTNERMTYTDVTKILRDNDVELIERYKDLVDDFKAMEELCKILRKKRLDRGAIDFDFEECKIILDEKGKTIDIKPYERAIANRMIEEFMLLANETVAEHMEKLKVPFVYRIHENPDAEKLEKFKAFIYNLGYNDITWGEEVNPKALQRVLDKFKGENEETIISTLLLRSMMQARYSPECAGHFGLAADYYCHFTSPIRRYPDLQIHRIIKEYLNKELTENRSKKLVSIVDSAAKQSSEMERVAQEAEREVDDLKKAEYMKDRIGEIFEGMISSVTGFGAFVELPNTIEGLVHITSFRDDYYIYDEDRLILIGERNKKIYRLGDKLKVLCSKVDILSREVYFEIVEDKYILEEKERAKKIQEEKLENIKRELNSESLKEDDI
ncbi:MAG: ribonuclease R [Sarcina ventriculi]|uniref:Ribonuclease R n=1 Tax=Sarcina ventriculi TaxID=1267 RepID=A0ABM9UPK4_SARVE|nr:ribonuclease R [Sarcina ventriculi]MBU5322521.1 ribonuclease R [Sarcina ventriculi]MCI5635706.1 ribonuclease R [Sarcina ventriculi]MDY7062411.1 ribonuclease R [Sarcina ventriculi]CUN80226.1 Ribonuclease R [Sarcina ventriculi]